MASKPRLPKPYTDEQLLFLRSHIPAFESRTRAHVRGDAKKFALDRASEFLVRFGLPQDLQGVDEAEPRFREQIYNWYKNTVGRARRKLEGRTRPRKQSDKPAGSISWSPSLTTSFPPPSDSPDSSAHPLPHVHTAQQQQQLPQPGPSTQQLQFSFQPAVPVQVSSPTPITLSVTHSALRDAFITHAIDSATLSSLIQSFVLAHPSPTPLTSVIHALFDAAKSLLASATSVSASPSSASVPNPTVEQQTWLDVLCALLRRFLDACAFFPSTLVHADLVGPLAGSRALQTALRRSSVWALANGSSGAGAVTPGASLSDEMERIRADRQRRKDHVQWAQIHAAAIELGIIGGTVANPTTAATVGVPVSVGAGTVNANGGTAPAYLHHRPTTAQGQEQLGYAAVSPLSSADYTFSEMMARDAVWEIDEVEWVAGIIVLRAIIRTRGVGRKAEWEQLLATYERRWKEIKDEARQALVTDVLLGARDDLARLDDTRVT